jgi:hypothetical protein
MKPDREDVEVRLAEGLDPNLEKRSRRELFQFVAARFERWATGQST